MPLPDSISFSLEGQPRIPTVNGDAPPPGDVFGSDFAGTFKLRWPTLADRRKIGAGVTAYFQGEGVLDPSMAPLTDYQLARALTYVEVLALDKPSWWPGEKTPHTPELELAIVRTLAVAAAAFDVAQKKTAPSGAS